MRLFSVGDLLRLVGGGRAIFGQQLGQFFLFPRFLRALGFGLPGLLLRFDLLAGSLDQRRNRSRAQRMALDLAGVGGAGAHFHAEKDLDPVRFVQALQPRIHLGGYGLVDLLLGDDLLARLLSELPMMFSSVLVLADFWAGFLFVAMKTS